MDKAERGQLLRARLKALEGLPPPPGVPRKGKALPLPKRGAGQPLAGFPAVIGVQRSTDMDLRA